MKSSASIAALILAAAPSLVMAQDISGGLTLGFGHTDVSDVPEDITTLTLDGRVDLAFDSGLTLGARLDAVRGEMDGMAGDITGTVLGATAGYRFGNGLELGLYAEKAELSVDGLGVDPSATSLGVTAGYAMNGVQLGGFFGRTTTDPDLPAGVDVKDLGLSIAYDASDRFLVGANVMRTRLSSGGTDVDLDMVGIAAAYEFNDKWTGFGGVSRTSLDLVNADLTTFGFGVSYDLSSLLNFGSVASIELARTDADLGGTDGSLDTVRFGFTIPLGGKTATGAKKVPLNSVADAVLNPTHSVLSSTVLTAF